MHEELGADWLAERFGPEVSEPVRLHVAAKRYLCAVESDYFGKLVARFGAQPRACRAGRCRPTRSRRSARNPLHAEAVRLRRFDEAAKDPRATTPDFDHFLRHVAVCRRADPMIGRSRRRGRLAPASRPHVRRTPVIELPAGTLGVARAGRAEARSRCRSAARSRAAAPSTSCWPRKVPAAGIVAASGGNHGAAAAYAARALGHKAEIFVPTIASPTKVARLKSYGAVVHQVGAVYAEARAASEKRAAETGALIVPAYEDEVVFAGAGSVALEFAEQARFDTLAGRGGRRRPDRGLRGGDRRDGTKIVAVETEGTPTLLRGAPRRPAGRRDDLRHRRRCAGRQPHRHAQLRDRPEAGARRPCW